MSQVIKKRRIVLASLLKPVDDTRMLEKIGATLTQTNTYDITIIGYPTTATDPNTKNITLAPLKKFSRTIAGRLAASLEVLKKIHKVKPELIIINTPELLWVALLNRIFFGRKIVYDVLENYYRNVRYTTVYPFWIRLPLSIGVRLMEWLSKLFVHHYFLAEKSYQHEFSFAAPYTLLENKLPQAIIQTLPPQRTVITDLIFTGTLASTTGVLEAIDLADGLHAVDDRYTLTIVGYSANTTFLTELRARLAQKNHIKLIGGDHLVPHQTILKEISRCGTGIVIYKVNPSTVNSIPTKLYEYLALRKVVLIQHNEASHELVRAMKAGLMLTQPPDFAALHLALQETTFTHQTSSTLYWESQEKGLLNCLKDLGI